MRILHTADLHLRNPKDERFKALECIFDKCSINEEKVDLLTISGDLFDNKENIYNLRVELRNLIEEYGERDSFFKPKFKILIIPGNHDETLYDINDYLGSNVELLCGKNVCSYNTNSLNIIGIPYFKGDFDSIISEIEDAKKSSKVNILLVHCTLGFPEIRREGCGEDREYNYLPISMEQLIYLDYDYVLAGHFHSSYIQKSFQKSQDSKKNWFIYPGSPVKITRNEKGKRRVCLIDTETQFIKPIELDTLYFDTCNINFHPYNMGKGLIELYQFIDKHKQNLELNKAELEISLNGYISIPEKEFKEEVEKITGNIKYKNNVVQVSEILNNSIFIRFKEILDQRDITAEKKEELFNFIMGAF